MMYAQDANAGHATANPVYDRDVSELYDLFYSGRGQDFASDAGILAKIILDRKPDARSVLDVGCGTGEHLRSLAVYFDDTTGLEKSAPMCALARAKQPEVPIYEDDMRTFDLDRSFAAICCLTSTIGYAADVTELEATFATMARHLVPGGVLLIDPYWSPDNYIDGHIGHHITRDDTRTVARLSHATRSGTSVRHEAHYLIADASGIRHVVHTQPLTLFTESEYLSALERVGCVAEYVSSDGGFADRGLFIGVRQS